MAQQRVLGKPSVRRVLECIDVVDPFAGKAAFAVEVLINVGDRRRIRVDAGMSRMDRGEIGAVRAGERDSHARLKNSVAAGDAADSRIAVRPVEWVGNAPDQQLRRVARQYGVGVERDDIANVAERGWVADDGGESVTGCPAQEPVELGELPTFPLPPHPHILSGVPEAWPMKEEEDVGAAIRISRIQLLGARGRGGKYRLVAFAKFSRRISV